jgi:hypothetical protein
MSTDRDTKRVVRSWMQEGVSQLPDRVLDAVLDQLPATHQRRAGWLARRFPIMNNTALRYGIAAVVVVAAAIVGLSFLPGTIGVGGPPEATPTPTPASTSAPSAGEPTSAPGGSLPEGPFTIVDEGAPNSPLRTTVTIASSGWTSNPEFGAVGKGDAMDPPEAVLLAWSWPAGTAFSVYEDPCQWASSAPDTPATTVDEIVTALAAQPSRNASDIADVTVGGYAGKHITLHVPEDAVFADCDQGNFASYGEAGASEPSRYHQGPGQIDELWVLDVDGVVAILDGMYRPSTPAELVEELRALAESATFEAP